MVTSQDDLAAAMRHAATLPDRQREMTAMLVQYADFHFNQELLDAGRFHLEDLREVCRQLASILPDSPLLHRTTALCEARAGEYDHAYAALRRFLELRPGAGFDSRREMLRLEWLRPGSSAESRAETARIAVAGTKPVTQESYRVQSLVAAGEQADLAGVDALVLEDLRRCDAALAAKASGGDAAAAAVRAILARLRSADRIALVGNGPSVRGRGLGRDVEAHDCVVRFNFPKLAGFEVDVGRRTDLMFIDASHRLTMHSRIQWEPEYPIVPALATSGGERPPEDPPPGLPQDFINLGDAISYDRGTTGFRAIVMAALIFRRPVTLYGFDFFPPGQVGHYFGGGAASVHHEVGYEAWFVRQFLADVLPDLRIA